MSRSSSLQKRVYIRAARRQGAFDARVGLIEWVDQDHTARRLDDWYQPDRDESNDLFVDFSGEYAYDPMLDRPPSGSIEFFDLPMNKPARYKWDDYWWDEEDYVPSPWRTDGIFF